LRTHLGLGSPTSRRRTTRRTTKVVAGPRALGPLGCGPKPGSTSPSPEDDRPQPGTWPGRDPSRVGAGAGRAGGAVTGDLFPFEPVPPGRPGQSPPFACANVGLKNSSPRWGPKGSAYPARRRPPGEVVGCGFSPHFVWNPEPASSPTTPRTSSNLPFLRGPRQSIPPGPIPPRPRTSLETPPGLVLWTQRCGSATAL